jgi:hypothetical protein
MTAIVINNALEKWLVDHCDALEKGIELFEKQYSLQCKFIVVDESNTRFYPLAFKKNFTSVAPFIPLEIARCKYTDEDILILSTKLNDTCLMSWENLKKYKERPEILNTLSQGRVDYF